MTTSNEHRFVYRIQFNPSTDMGAVEEILLSAILSVECLHGEAAVRLEAGYSINQDQHLVVLLAGTPMALAVARMFVGMCSHEFGEQSFRILRGIGTPLKEAVTAV